MRLIVLALVLVASCMLVAPDSGLTAVAPSGSILTAPDGMSGSRAWCVPPSTEGTSYWCYGPGGVRTAERSLTFPPLNPSARVWKAARLRLVYIIVAGQSGRDRPGIAIWYQY